MAENEIIKHTEKAVKIVKSPGSLRHKLGEIVIEILIIVFAVTVSIWLHNGSERAKERKEEKIFLAGLEKDLKTDIDHMSNSLRFYRSTVRGLKYFIVAGESHSMNKDSVSFYSNIFFSSTLLDPAIARYEGLKNSGKFRIIEDNELLNDIISLYEGEFRRIDEVNERYYQHNRDIETLISQHLELGPGGKIKNIDEIISRNDFKIMVYLSIGLIENNNLPALESGLRKCRSILRRITANP
jgi:hypothetical protein